MDILTNFEKQKILMKIKQYTLTLLCGLALMTSCKKDDDGGGSSIVERDRTQQQVIDRDSLLGYFDTHYYNSDLFLDGNDHSIYDILITELPKDEEGNYIYEVPDGHTLLSDALEAGDLEVKTTVYQETNYEYYVLKLNQGGGESPTFADDVRLNYVGNLQDASVFDSTVNPTDFDLLNLIQGWRLVLPQFSAATSFVENGDGTTTYINHGLGVMFLPSGLAYYASPPIGVSAYSNLIFRFELFQTETNDHDNDGIPSHIEITDNSNLFNDDTDDDDVPNFLDIDDDGDGIATINELEPSTYIVDTNIGETEPVLAEDEFERSRTTTAGVITIKTVKIVDTNNNNVPDYLDEDVTNDYSEE